MLKTSYSVFVHGNCDLKLKTVLRSLSADGLYNVFTDHQVCLHQHHTVSMRDIKVRCFAIGLITAKNAGKPVL